MTPKQRDIMKHALGAGRGNPGWRNHFVTGPGSDDYDDCETLVAAGLMTKRSGGPLSGGDPVYRVTDAGQDALVGRPKTPNVLVIRREGIPPCFVKALKRDGRPVMTWDEVDARRLGDVVAERHAERLRGLALPVEVERAA